MDKIKRLSSKTPKFKFPHNLGTIDDTVTSGRPLDEMTATNVNNLKLMAYVHKCLGNNKLSQEYDKLAEKIKKEIL